MLALLLLTCCLNAPLEVTVDSEMINVGAILPLPSSDVRSTVALGYAPNPGQARRIGRQEIIAKIEATGQSADGLEFPESILVHRRSGSVDLQMIKQAVLDAFYKQFPHDATVELVSVEPPATAIGTGDVTVSATLPARFDPNQPVFVRLDIRSGLTSRTVYARTIVRIEVVQPVLRTGVSANAQFQQGDVEWKSALISGNGPVTASLEAFQGMVAKRDLEAGEVLKSDLFYAPLYVRKGESVTVKATSGGVTIAATMRAMSAGRLGETIQVQHLTGTGSTTARIVGLRMLEAIQR